MESLRMNYRFTALLIVMITLLALFGGPAHSKNEYLQNDGGQCVYGSMEAAITKVETEHDYRIPSTSDYDNDRHELRLSFRKNLGLSKKNCDTQNRMRTDNLILKQQLELLKHCNKVNANPSYLYNENFRSLALKCKGIVSVNEEVLNKKDEGNHWENLKKEYMEKNPGDYMGEDATKKLKIPKYLTDELPVPTND